MAQDTNNASAPKPATPSLMDVIARQRASLGMGTAPTPPKPQADAAVEVQSAAAAPAQPAQAASPAKPAQDQDRPQSPQPQSQSQPSIQAKSPDPASVAAQEVAALLKEQEFDDVDQAELDAMNPAEAEMIRQMLAARAKDEPEPTPPADDAASRQAQADEPDDAPAAPAPQPAPRRMAMLHYVLAGNAVVLIAILCGIVYLAPRLQPAGATIQQPGKTQAAVAGSQAAPPAQPPRTDVPNHAAVSLAAVEKDFAAGNYSSCVEGYSSLLARATLATQTHNASMTNFLRLRLGQSLVKVQRADDARRHLQLAAADNSPALRVTGGLELARVEIDSNQYMLARSSACAAAAAAGFSDRTAPLAVECDLMAAKALSRKVLAMRGSGEGVACDARPGDIFAGLDEAAIRGVLAEGLGGMSLAAVGVQVRPEESNGVVRYDVACAGNSLDELLSRLVTASGTKLRFANVAAPQRARPITLACRGQTEQRVIDLACGSAGLIARFSGQEISVFDPAAVASLQEQQDLLTSEATSAWRRFFLRYGSDDRNADAHVALGSLMESCGDDLAAIGEYQITFSRFPKSQAAPQALLRSARLRIGMKDYKAAREDLSNVLDNYPSWKGWEEAYVSLGEAVMEGGALDEAQRIYRVLSAKEVSPAVRLQIARGNGKLMHLRGQHGPAVEQFKTYLAGAGAGASAQKAETWWLLGRSQLALGQTQQAAASLYKALAAGPAAKARFDVAAELVEALIAAQQYATALGVLRQAEQDRPSVSQQCRLLVLTGRLHRSMGLADCVVDQLRRSADTLADEALARQVRLELARCLASAKRPKEAHELLTQLLPSLDAAAVESATCDLAATALELDHPQQAIALCEELVRTCKDGAILKTARQILSQAHLASKDFASAAGSLATEGAKQ